jgi:hypothetical protein
MKILVYGTETFNDYSTFMRGLIVAIEDSLYSNDGKIEVYTAGPHKVNDFTAEFINRTEDFFKQKKIKTKFSRIRKSDVIEKFDSYSFDHVLSFNSKSDKKLFDVIIDKAETKKVPSSYYKY